MKKVFALRGKAHTGKSQTIRTVVEMLTAQYPTAIIEHNHKSKVDVRMVLTINGCKIGIESQGGPNSRLIKESLPLFVQLDCDVIVCATRTAGATVHAVNSPEGFEVSWIEQREQSQPNEQILRNIGIARDIVQRIETVIGAAEQSPALTRSATA